MTATLLDGKAVAQQIRDELGARVANVRQRLGRPPALAIVLVGDDPASEVYVRNKLKTAEDAGMGVHLERLPGRGVARGRSRRRRALQRGPELRRHSRPVAAAEGARRRSRAARVRRDRSRQGRRRLQPDLRGSRRAESRGFRAVHAGRGDRAARAHQDADRRQDAVVIGRSDIVGKPMAALLLHKNATVTICHSRTRDLPAMARTADILVAAIGRPAFVTRDFVKPGAVVIDVGINSVTSADEAKRIFARFSRAPPGVREDGLDAGRRRASRGRGRRRAR